MSELETPCQVPAHTHGHCLDVALRPQKGRRIAGVRSWLEGTQGCRLGGGSGRSSAPEQSWGSPVLPRTPTCQSFPWEEWECASPQKLLSEPQETSSGGFCNQPARVPVKKKKE